MQDSKGRNVAHEEDKKLAERKSEATTDETLSDLEEAESDSVSVSTRQDPGPSPDGAFDEKKETDDAGPM
jgi:hypothetical protein